MKTNIQLIGPKFTAKKLNIENKISHHGKNTAQNDFKFNTISS